MTTKYEVRSVNPDTLIRAGFRSMELAQAWIDARGKVAQAAYYATLSPSRK